jgi:hypothetical protein
VSDTNVLDPVSSFNAVAAERRREERLRVNIPGEITGVDRRGRLFVGRVTVQDVNEHGCRFESLLELECGDIVAIKPMVPGEKCLASEHLQLFEVVWADRQDNRWAVGASKLQGEKLTNLKFPPANYSPGRRPCQ